MPYKHRVGGSSPSLRTKRNKKVASPATFSQLFYNKRVHTQVVRNYYCARGNLRVPGFLYAIVVQLVERLPSKQDVLRVRVPSIAPSSTKYATLVERVQEEKASGADAYDGALCKGEINKLKSIKSQRKSIHWELCIAPLSCATISQY